MSTQSQLPLLLTNPHRGPVRPDRADRYTRIRPGVYAERAAWDELEPWEQYESRVRAYAAFAPETLLSHESAAVVHELPVFGNVRDVHVIASGTGVHAKRRSDVVVHASARARLGVMVDGFRATDLIDTAIDLGRVLAPAAALAVWDAVLARGVTKSELLRRWAAMPSKRGTRTLTWLGEFANPASESPAESLSRAVIAWLGFMAPELQKSFSDGEVVDRADFYWPANRTIGEFDGLAKYSMGDPIKRVRSEKTREFRFQRRGVTIVRWGIDDLLHPDRLEQMLLHAGIPRIARPDDNRLATMRHVFRSRRHTT